MHLTRLHFQNFRNIQNLDLSLDQGFVILAGANGMGKTNFLEAIYWGATLRRFPDSKLFQLVKDGENFYRISIEHLGLEAESLELTSQIEGEKSKFKYKINGLAVPRGKFPGHLPVISFLPEDLNLLTHSPSNRRRFLNEALSGVSVEYRRNLSQYEKALKQRNLALETRAALEIWDEQLADYGSKITAERAGFVDFISAQLGSVLSDISPEQKNSNIKYLFSGKADKAVFLNQLHDSRQRDEQTLTTSVGPHRDDFEILDNQHTIVGYLSRGQLRAITLTLKILERQYLQKKLNRAPILLLDDVFSEFDQKHQTDLMEFLKTFDQVFFTTAHLEEVQKFLPPEAQVYNVENGKIIHQKS